MEWLITLLGIAIVACGIAWADDAASYLMGLVGGLALVFFLAVALIVGTQA